MQIKEIWIQKVYKQCEINIKEGHQVKWSNYHVILGILV